MKQFTIYFELFGKKMKTTVDALSEERARERLKDKILFHKVEEIKAKPNNSVFDYLKKMAEKAAEYSK